MKLVLGSVNSNNYDYLSGASSQVLKMCMVLKPCTQQVNFMQKKKWQIVHYRLFTTSNDLLLLLNIINNLISYWPGLLDIFFEKLVRAVGS